MTKLAYVTAVEAVKLMEGELFITVGTRVEDITRTDVYGNHWTVGDTIMVEACEQDKSVIDDQTSPVAGKRLIKLMVSSGTDLRRVVVRGNNGLFTSTI